MGISRRPRLIAGVIIVVCIILLTKREYEEPIPKPKWDFKPPAGWPNSQKQPGETAPQPDPLLPVVVDDKAKEIPLFDTGEQIPGSAQLIEDAHKLGSADDFLPHFAAVRQLPGITMEEAKKTCAWPLGTTVNFQYNSEADWVNEDRPDQELATHRQEWQAYVETGMIPYSQARDKFSGRGIVICAGNQDTLMRLKVILRALNKLDSKIAIEVHYWDDEMNEESMQELASMYQPMFFNDLSGPHNILQVKKDQFWINYQLKTASIINSRFAEPLLLDSDNIPILDPATLYDSAVYREYGTVFWPDIARTRPNNPAWAITNTPCRMDEYEQESGQLLVDKARFWYHLQLAAWLNNEQGAYYNGFLLGDKDMFRFAWHALRTAYGRPRRWLTSVGTVNDGFYCGHSFAQHHPDDARVAFLHGGLVKTVDLEVMRWNREERGGYYRSYKRAPTDEDPAVSVNVAIKFDGADYMPNHRPDHKVAQCTDMFDVEPRDLNEIIFGFERTFEEIGGYWQLDDVKKDKPAGSSSV